MSRFIRLAAIVAVCTSFNSVLAQEVCFTDAKNNFANWQATNGTVLSDLAAKYEKSASPNTELVDYKGMKIPITAALLIESEQYGRAAEVKLTTEIDGAKKCSGQVTIPRGVYDLARDWLGITTIAPEKATRIDFAELQKGNLAGGPKSIVNETVDTTKKILNFTKWKF